MLHKLFNRTTTIRFFKTAAFVYIALCVSTSWATVMMREIYLLKGAWPLKTSETRFKEPAGLAIDQRGFLYIADRDGHRIQKLTPDGRVVDKWGRQGAAPGEFESPSGVAVDSGRGFVYVPDTGNHRIQKFTRHGDFLLQWGAPGDNQGEFNQPRGAAVDGNGFVYVADTGNNRIQKFTPDGEFVSQWGSFGSAAGQFNAPHDVLVNGDDVYVADTGNYRVQRFTTGGQYVGLWGGKKRFLAPVGLAVGTDNLIYVADKDNPDNPLMKFTPEGKVIYTDGQGNEFSMPMESVPAGDNQDSFEIWSPEQAGLLHPEAVAIASDGVILMADTGNDRIVRFTESGRKIDAFESDSGSDAMFNAPRVIARDAAGHIYIGDKSEDQFLKYTAQGVFVNAPLNTGSNAIPYPAGAVIDANGNFYLTDAENHKLLKYDAAGNPVASWGDFGDGPGQFNTPRGIALDVQGNIYVVDAGNNRICKLNPENGEFLTTWGASGGKDGQFNLPADIAIDKYGQIFVTDSGNQRVQVFKNDGLFIRQWDGLGSFENPQGIATDADGKIYVADTGARQVFKLSQWGHLIATIGEPGSGAGGFIMPVDVAVDNDGRVLVIDTANQNVQVFQNDHNRCGRQKAIIIAGSGTDDYLWEETQLCANLAYRAMLHQGFTSETIHYLSANTDLDMDDDGLPDVDGTASNESLQNAFGWAKDAESVVIYMVDHGGHESFRLSGDEMLSADRLDSWLDDLQEDAEIDAAVIYDACLSASFKEKLTPNGSQKRLFIASAADDQDASFAGYAALSFSNYFWSDIMVGKSVTEAFERAHSAMAAIYQNQTPFKTTYNDNSFTFCLGSIIGGDDQIPQIETVETDPCPTLDGSSKAHIIANDVTDDNGRIERVWAVIRPPLYGTIPARNPVLNLPTVDLLPIGVSGQYNAEWKRFALSGEYVVAVFARDNAGQISDPETTTLTVSNPVKNRAILIAGASDDTEAELRTAIHANIRSAYDALRFQSYHPDDILVISAEIIDGVDKDPTKPQLANVEEAVKEWAADKTQDVLIYLTGKGEEAQFQLNTQKKLTAVKLDEWIDSLQQNKDGIVTVVYDACHSGSFLPLLTPPKDKKRIVISSSPVERCALMQDQEQVECGGVTLGGEHSFSAYFWEGVKNGLSVGQAFDKARQVVETITSLLKGGLIEPQLDDNGNGIGNETEDGVQAGSHYIGAGIELADNGPLISAVSEPQTLIDGAINATLWAEVTATAGVSKVWAVITPPEHPVGSETLPIMDLPTVELTYDDDEQRYQGNYNAFDTFGIYGITIHARDNDCKVSLPASTRVDQTQHAGDCLRSVQVGDQVHSFWSVDCLSMFSPGNLAWNYTFQITEEQQISINLNSNANTALILWEGQGIGGSPPIVSDNGPNPLISETLAPGWYTIEVVTYDQESFNDQISIQDYKLEVQLADRLPPKGTLKVIIKPEEVFADCTLPKDCPQWRVDGGEWRNSESVHSGLAMGAHTVMFKKMSGWVRPNSIKIEVNREEGIAVTGEYTSETEIFAAAYGGEDDETMTASALVSDGGLIATGYVDTSGPGGRDLWIVKLSPGGEIEKQFTYGGAGVDMGWSVDATPDGGAIIAGVTPSADGDRDIVILKLDDKANVLWKKTYGNTLNQDHPSIRRADGSSFIMSAETETNDFNGLGINTWVVKLDHAGLIEWEDVLNYGFMGSPGKIKNPVVAVTTGGYTVVASSSGNFFWNKFHSNGSHYGDIVLTSDGDESEPRIVRSETGVMLAGTTYTEGSGIINIWLTKLDHNGQILWKKTVGEPGTIHNLANLCATADGGWMVAANRTGGSYGGDLSLFKLDKDGAIEWQQAYSNEESDGLEACSVHQTADGHYLVAGNRYQGQNDYFVFRMEDTGSLPGCTMELPSNLQTDDDPPIEIPSWKPLVVHDKMNVTPVSDHFTVMAWIKATKNFKDRNVVFWSEDQQPGIELNDNQVRFTFKRKEEFPPKEGDLAGFVSSQTIEINEWVHVACTWDGKVYKGYVDSVWAGEIALPYFDLGGQIRIGQDDGPGPDVSDPSKRNFDGHIDDVRIYASALSDTQIAKAMDSDCQLADSGAWIRNMMETVYEDAEDGSASQWVVYDDQDPKGANIFNVYDEEKQSHVIEVHGTGNFSPGQDGFKLKNFENTDQFIAQWSMKLIEEAHTIYWDVETADGNRWFIDYRADRPQECIVNLHNDKYITCGLGSEIKDGQWHTIVRDLRADLKYADPDNELKKVKSFRIRGHARVDDIKLRSVWPVGEDPTFSDANCAAENGGSVDFTTDLVGDFRFEDNLQEEVNDGLEGSQEEGGVAFISGHDGKGIELDGSGYVDYGDLPGTAFTGKEAFTVSMWVQDGARGVALSRHRYYFRFTDANISFRLKKQDTGTAEEQDPYHLNVPYPDNWKSGQWNHVTFVHYIKGRDNWQTVDRLIYVNGRLAGGTPEFYDYKTHTFTSEVSLLSLKIGKTVHQGGIYFKGGMDDVRIFRRALTPCEIEVLASGLKGHWKFNERTGYKAEDSSGNGHHGAIVGAKHCAGLYDDALYFDDGSTEDDRIISLGNMDDYTSGHFTVMAWIKASQLKSHTYILHAAEDRPGISIADNGGVKFCFKPSTADEPLSGQENCFVSDPISIEQWIHVACSWDGATYSGYINGQTVGTRNLPFFQLGGVFNIGDDSIDDIRNFMGVIDDVRIYNQAFTQEQISDLAPAINATADLMINTIAPDHGAATGGDLVTITGEGFTTGAAVASIIFGGLPAEEVTVVSDTQITCKTPVHPVEKVNVVVTLTDGQSVGRHKGYTYTGMAANWRFDNDFRDEVSSVNGIEHGAVTFFEGRSGQAAAFDGVDDYLEYNDLPNTDFTGEDPFTVSMWVKDGSVGRMISRWRYYMRIKADKTIMFHFKKSKFEQDPYSLETPIPLNWEQDDWNHLAFVYGGEDGQRAIYVNGELVGAIDHPTFNSSYELKSLKIGKTDHMGGHYFAGQLDDVKIYNRALSPCELELINSTLAGRWPFDGTDDKIALDVTGKENHGVIKGTARVAGKYGGALDFSVDNDINHKDRVVLPHTMQYYIAANMHAGDSKVSPYFYCHPYDGENQIIAVPPPHIVSGGANEKIWVDIDFEGDPQNVTVWAEITGPDGETVIIESDKFTYNLATRLWEADITNLNLYGKYIIVFHAQVGDETLIPEKTTVFQDSNPDMYEDDDTFETAADYDPESHEVQRHNFDNYGDEDWIKFTGRAGELYRIKVHNADVRCDAMIDLYDAQENFLASSDWGWAGDNEVLEYEAEADGDYFVKISQYNAEVHGVQTGYDLIVYRPVAHVEAIFTGDVKYNNTPFQGATVTIDLEKGPSQSFTTGNDGKYEINFDCKAFACVFRYSYTIDPKSDCLGTITNIEGKVIISGAINKIIEESFSLSNGSTSGLTVNIEPNNIGAQWRISKQGYHWRNSGDTEPNLVQGKNYLIEFSDINCWQKPAAIDINLNECKKIVKADEAKYIQSTGNLKVTIIPQDAIDSDAHAQWQIEGQNEWIDSGQTTAVCNDYTITFKEIPGWIKPSNMSLDINTDKVTVEYVPKTNPFVAAYGGIRNEKILSSDHTADGGFILAGWTESFGAGDRDIWLLKLDKRGEVEWQKTFGTNENTEIGYSVQQTRDNEGRANGYIVAGVQYASGSENNDILVFKLYMDGNVTDSPSPKRYDVAGDQNAPVIRQRHEPQDGYILAAETAGAVNTDILIIKLKENLDVVSQNQYGGLGDETDPSIDLTGDGYVVACTSDSSGTGKRDIWIFEISDGNPAAIKRQKAFGGDQDNYAPVIRKTDDGYMVAATTNPFGMDTRSILLFKFKLNDTEIIMQEGWPKVLAEEYASHSCADLQITNDGGFIIAGNRQKAEIPNALTLFKAAENGELQWQRSFHNENINMTEARAVHQTAGGLFAVTGFMLKDGYDYLVLTSDPEGNIPECNLSESQAALVAASTDKTLTEFEPISSTEVIAKKLISYTEKTDVAAHFLCNPDGQGPEVTDVVLEPELNACSTQSVLIRAKVEGGYGQIKVWAVITPPGNQKIEPDTVYLERTGEHYKNSFNDFPFFGKYKITVYASDENGATSFPQTEWQEQQAGADKFETKQGGANDNDNETATPLSGEFNHIQQHNFHTPEDVDWVKIPARAGICYQIIIDNLGADCGNMELEVYQSSVTSDNFILRAKPNTDGVINRGVCAKENAWFLLKMSNPDQNDSACDTGYDIGASIGLKGDINGDEELTLKDSIIGMQMLTGYPDIQVNPGADVNCDNRIGMAEVIYVQEKLAGLVNDGAGD